MARAPGARCVGYRRAASNGADREAGLKAPALPDQTAQNERSSRGRGKKLAAEPRNRRARVPKGNALGRATAPSWLRSRHPCPVAPSPALAGGAGGAGEDGRW